MVFNNLTKLIPELASLDVSKFPLSRKRLDEFAKKRKFINKSDEYMVFYILPSGFSLKGSLDKEKNINALWITLYLWEDCFEEDYESEEEYEEARGEFDKIFEKVFKVLEKKLGKPAVKGISKDEDAFHYACWEYKKDCVLCLEQNDRDIEEGMEVSITLTPLKKKAKPVFIYL